MTQTERIYTDFFIPGKPKTVQTCSIHLIRALNVMHSHFKRIGIHEVYEKNTKYSLLRVASWITCDLQ